MSSTDPRFPQDPFHPPQPPSSGADVVQAGFVRRWAALFLDSLLISCGFYAVFFLVIMVIGVAGGFDALSGFDSEDPPAWVVGSYLGLYLVYFVIAGLYYAVLESSSSQATVGKMALGIKVVDRDGRRLTFPHALGRWFAAALSYATLYIGFLMAAFTERKQALHDLVAGTFVVDKWAYTDRPELQQRGLSGCLIVFLVFIGLGGVLAIVGIVAAISIPAYQDYASRARAASVPAIVAPLKLQVADTFAQTGECPTNTSAGYDAPADYAEGSVARIVLGPIEDYDDGGCGIVVWMRPSGGIEETSITFEYLTEQDSWVCTSDLPEEQLPAECR